MVDRLLSLAQRAFIVWGGSSIFEKTEFVGQEAVDATTRIIPRWTNW